MARPQRINPAGGIHHITNHRAGDGDLFLTNSDRLLFLDLIETARKETGVRIHAYCLMGNHYHLIVECPGGQLHRFIHYLQGNYARAFNYRHNHKGPVFRRRYHNVLITNDGHFQVEIRYVHRNPLELGYDIRSYPWSDYPDHAGVQLPTAELITTETSIVRSLFGASINYVNHVEVDADRDKFRTRNGTRQALVTSRPSVEVELDRLVEIVITHLGCDRSELQGSRPGRRHDARLIGVTLASDRFPIAASQVRSTFGFTSVTSYRSALSRGRNQLARDLPLAALRDEIAAAWRGNSTTAAA
jgi:putative transposase